MPSNQQNFPTLKEYCNFLPAVLRKNCDGRQIEYYVYNPASNKLERKRMLLNKLRKRYRSHAEFRVVANDIVCAINNKL